MTSIVLGRNLKYQNSAIHATSNRAVWLAQLRIQTTVNSRLKETPLLRTLAIADKIQIPIYRGLTENDFRYYGLLL